MRHCVFFLSVVFYLFIAAHEFDFRLVILQKPNTEQMATGGNKGKTILSEPREVTEM